MTLFHFTAAWHLPTILEAGFLKTVESNVSFSRAQAGPDVVWLLDQAEPDWVVDTSHGLSIPKRDIRFEVDVPAIKWSEWAPAAAMTTIDRRVLVEAGGGVAAAEHWYIFPARIPARRWVKVVDLRTGEEIAA